MAVRFHQLVDRLAAALSAGGWTIIESPARPTTRPARLRVAAPGPGAGETRTLLVYAWNATHGGNTRSDDEFRVQMTGVAPPLLIEAGAQTLLLGLSPGEGVMTAWDATYHVEFTPGSPSLQTRRTAIDHALATGWGFHRRANGEVPVSFLDEYLGAYVQAQAALHAVREDAFAALEQAGAEALWAGEQEPAAVEDEGDARREDEDAGNTQERVLQLVRRTGRDQSFRQRILAAYGAACCGCGIQLGLVQGAHIVPVAVRPNFSTRNGLALCANHHVAYDTGLFAVLPDYRIVVNEDAVRVLNERALLGGADLVLGTLAPMIRLPPNTWECPAGEFLEEAVEHRARAFPFA
jgi:putative restriction endonuclease